MGEPVTGDGEGTVGLVADGAAPGPGPPQPASTAVQQPSAASTRYSCPDITAVSPVPSTVVRCLPPT